MLRIILILTMVGLFAVAGVYLVQAYRTQGGLVKSAQDRVPTIAETDPEPPIFEPFDKEVLVRITESGFDPVELKTTTFVEIIFQNETGETVNIDHLPKPGERRMSSFNRGEILPGESSSFQFYYDRDIRFYDEYHPERIGYIFIN